MDKTKLALQLYSVRNELQDDFYGTLKKIKEFGYSGVEFAGLHGKDPLEVKKNCEEIGLIPISAHVGFAALLNSGEEIVDCYEKLGTKYIGISKLPTEYLPGHPDFSIAIDVIKKMGARLAERNMVLQYHNHDFEFEKINGEYGLDILYREVPANLLQTQLDTCWINVGGENPAEYVKKYSGRMPTVHLKDFAGVRSKKGSFEFRPLGKGLQNFDSIIKSATECGAEWFIVEQDDPSMGYTALECAKLSVQYLLSL